MGFLASLLPRLCIVVVPNFGSSDKSEQLSESGLPLNCSDLSEIRHNHDTKPGEEAEKE